MSRLHYRVPFKPEYDVETKFYSYKGNDLEIEKVTCSSKLVAIGESDRFVIYIDLDNGNIVSGYRPGGEAFLLGNVISLFEDNGFEVPKGNLVYWIESFCMGELLSDNLGYALAENMVGGSLLQKVLCTSQKQSMAYKLTEHVRECLTFMSTLEDVFKGRASRIAEYNMISKSCLTKRVLPTTEELAKMEQKENLFNMNSYLRARNRDLKMLYCRVDDKYYITYANGVGLNRFTTKLALAETLRGMSRMDYSDMREALSSGDSSPSGKLHDFSLDLAKINQMLKIEEG